MEREFVPYELAMKLKELGFDEPCFGCFNHLDKSEIWTNRTYTNGLTENITAPTFSQAFRFFTEKYGLYHHIVPEFYTKGINFNWQILWYLPKEEWTNHVISDGTALYGDNGEYPTQEQAELACLRKLIEIVKEKS